MKEKILNEIFNACEGKWRQSRKIERNNIKVKITNYQDIIFILFIFKIHTNRPCTKINIF